MACGRSPPPATSAAWHDRFFFSETETDDQDKASCAKPRRPQREIRLRAHARFDHAPRPLSVPGSRRFGLDLDQEHTRRTLDGRRPGA